MLNQMRSDYYFVGLLFRRYAINIVWLFGLMSREDIAYLRSQLKTDYLTWRYYRKQIYAFDEYGKRYKGV